MQTLPSAMVPQASPQRTTMSACVPATRQQLHLLLPNNQFLVARLQSCTLVSSVGAHVVARVARAIGVARATLVAARGGMQILPSAMVPQASSQRTTMIVCVPATRQQLHLLLPNNQFLVARSQSCILVSSVGVHVVARVARVIGVARATLVAAR